MISFLLGNNLGIELLDDGEEGGSAERAEVKARDSGEGIPCLKTGPQAQDLQQGDVEP